MAEYIKKSIAIAIVNDAKDMLSFEKIGAAIQIATSPAADVAPVVHGRWLPVNGHWGPKIVRRGYQCSLCGRIENQREPYCHCGARMNLRGEDNDGTEKA